MTFQTTLEQSIRGTGVFRCLECGKCTAVCPISRHDHRFSPRRTVGRALMRHDEALLTDDRLWACLTCLCCSEVCPAGVAYSDLTFTVRAEARRLGQAAVCTHGEIIHSWMRMMMDPALKQNRLSWLDNQRMDQSTDQKIGKPAKGQRPSHESRITNHGLRISADSDTLYFVGCAPYFSVQFGHIGVDGDAVARATVKAINALGIEPRVLADERCCGHDLLWEGDLEGFRRLAELNAELVRRSGVKRIVTSCPECARALKVDYPEHGIELGVEVLHLVELLVGSHWFRPEPSSGAQAEGAQLEGSVVAGGSRIANSRVTYHDACRLGRHLGVYDAPRQVIGGVGLELIEMPRRRENALCCGTNGWTHCGAANKQIQADRLLEAQATGADVLVTACLKCQIHFKCTMQDRELDSTLDIEIKDFATVLAEALG